MEKDTHCKTNPTNNTEPAVCRVCLGNSNVMVNISQCTTGSSISIADMISQFTGHRVSPGDSYPQSICLPCLEDVPSAFRIKQTYEKSYSLYCQREEEVLGTNEEMLTASESPTSDEESYTNELFEEYGSEEQEYHNLEPLCEIKTEDESYSVANAEENSKGASLTTPIKCSRCQSTFPGEHQLLTHMEERHLHSARSGINFNFLVGLRKGSRLIHTVDDNQLYWKKLIQRSGETVYLCRVRGCKAKVFLTADKTQVYARTDEVHHSHDGPDLEIKKMLVMDEVANKCLNENSNFKKFFNDVIAEYAEQLAELKISRDNLRRIVDRRRQIQD